MERFGNQCHANCDLQHANKKIQEHRKFYWNVKYQPMTEGRSKNYHKENMTKFLEASSMFFFNLPAN
jgi:hypothetical protein